MRAIVFILFCIFSSYAAAQSPLKTKIMEYSLDSGLVKNTSLKKGVIYQKTIQVKNVPWIRLHFSKAHLGQDSQIRITSLLDGAVQIHDAETLAEWRNTSAYFNGDSVSVELLGSPGKSAQIKIHEISVGEMSLPNKESPNRSICGATDDRVLSTDARTARIMPVGCTAWLIDDAKGCFLTAGHCVDNGIGIDGSFSIVEFDVPLSNDNGSTNHSSPDNQYAIDFSSLQWDLTEIGNDWAYFGAYPNSQTKLTPFEAQGENFVLATPPVAPSGEIIRVTGYGSIDGTQGTPLNWSQTQTTHTGDLTNVNGTVLQYAVDTTGGDSGSAVEVEGTGTAIGIHTNAGCSDSGGANHGTSLANAALQNALANPVGLCLNGAPEIRINQITPIATDIPRTGSTFSIDILDRQGSPATFNSANLVYSYGGPEDSIPLQQISGSTYQATLPPSSCGNSVDFKIEVETTNGGTVYHPFSAQNSADRRFIRRVGDSFNDEFRDTFESDLGWTVDNDPSLTAGAWERGVPAGYGYRQDPPWDGDSSGSAYVTGNAGGNTDVDGGATRLVSPVMDASNPNSHIAYWRWWRDLGTSDDSFVVQVSDDAGANWVTVETISTGIAAEWVFQKVKVSDYVLNTNQFQIRFIAQDTGAGSVIEAGVDGVTLEFDLVTENECALFENGFEIIVP